MRGNLSLDGYWQTEKYFQDIAAVLRAEFTAKHEVDVASKDVSQAIMGVPSVCIHIRPFTFRFREKRNIVRLGAQFAGRPSGTAPRLGKDVT